MASCNLKKTSGKTGAKGTGSIALEYELITDSVILDPLDALAIARGLGVPQYGAQWSNAYWFAQDFSMDRIDGNRAHWDITVTFSPPPEGEDDEQQNENPLARPAVYDIQYIEQEYVIEEARNVEAFGTVFTRAPDTLGPIVNACYRRPDEPIVDTERNGVIVIEKNVPTLGAVMALNNTYARTCNSDTCTVGGQSIDPRRLKFLCARSGGRQQEGDIVYYPAIIEIEIKKTTDKILDNVGYEYWNDDADDFERAKDKDGEFVGDPVNLNLDGTLNESDPTTISYRYLTEVAYSGFFS
jgi:hypothetical protein